MHPVLFRIGGFDVAFYGPLIALGVLLGVMVAVRRAKTIGLEADLIFDLTFYCVIIGFVGSRVFFILGDLRGFFQSPSEYIFSRQGYVFFGGLIFALIFALWFLHRKRADPWQVGDVMAPSIALGHMFGRIGCFFSGCCYGAVCLPQWRSLGVTFPKADPLTGTEAYSFAYTDQLTRGLIGPEALRTLPVYPVQLFEAAANLLIFLGLIWLWRKRRFRGQIFAGYLIAYGTARFLLEFLRGDYDERNLFKLLARGQMSQIICLAAIAIGAYIWWRRRATPLESPVLATDNATPPADPAPAENKRKARHHRHHR